MKVTIPPVPQHYDPRYMAEVLSQIETALNGLVTVDVLHVAPDKPRSGMVAIADGTDWAPGSGTGTYVYFGTWRRMD